MQRTGFQVLAAIDFNKEAIATFKVNFSNGTLALQKDLTKFTPDQLATKLGINHVDVIVGGPPCQGFSMVRQVKAANHGSRVRRDKRRYYYRRFLEYVRYFQPRVFVMENVLGIQSAVKGKFLPLMQADARKLGYPWWHRNGRIAGTPVHRESRLPRWENLRIQSCRIPGNGRHRPRSPARNMHTSSWHQLKQLRLRLESIGGSVVCRTGFGGLSSNCLHQIQPAVD